MEFKYLLFCASQANKWFVVHEGFIDFKRNLTEGNLMRKCV